MLSRIARSGAVLAMSAAALPVVGVLGAAPANALAPISCDTIYAMENGVVGPRPGVDALDATTGALTQVVPLSSSLYNALAVDGRNSYAYLFRGSILTRVDTVTGATKPYSDVVFPVTPPVMGAYDATSGIYYHGIINAGVVEIRAFDTTTETPIPGIIGRVTIGVGGNGDFAFDGGGRLYVVSAGVLLRLNDPLPTTGTVDGPLLATTTIANPPVGQINSMAFGADGYLYLGGGRAPQSVYKVNPSSGAVVSSVPYTPTTAVISDYASCALPNAIQVRKTLPDGRVAATDQFGLSVTGGGLTTGNTGTTAGDETGLQDQDAAEVAGPVLGLSGVTYTIAETAAGTTDLADYASSWECVNTLTDTVVASGTGSTGTFTMPNGGANGTNVVCTFANDALLPELEVSKSATPASGATVPAGDTITYTHTFDNTAGDAPASVDWDDVVAGVLDDATMLAPPVASAGSLTASPVESGRFSVTGTVPAGQAITVSYTVRVSPEAQRGDDVLENFLVPAGDRPPAGCVESSPLCTVHIPSDAPANVVDAKTVSPASGTLVGQGQQVTYTLSFTNQGGLTGPVDRVDDLTHVLDDAAITAAPVSSDPALAVSPVVGGRFAITGDLAAGQTVTVTYTATVKPVEAQGDRVLSNFLLGQDDPTPPAAACPAGSQDCTSHPVAPPVVPPAPPAPPVAPPAGAATFDLDLDKTAISGAKATVGDEVRYRLQVTNTGPDAAPGPIRLVDRLPDGLQLVSVSGKGWNCRVNKATDTVRCSRQNGLAADTAAPSVVVTTKATKAAVGRVVNIARVRAPGDADVASNRDKAKVVVAPVPALPSTGFRTNIHGWS
ncbi:DUF11 domain-containing protein [Nocardioides sp. SYSU D00065]|uniref:DUF7927 domain-containing protein n=1 Tax=Nocardioides sp. SYSU D00065 TaxID=2817378 RepID=UPI001B339416|nr:DUF11 domain-containing protein [Nocardioides sp. SYSU D00065]